MKYITTILVGLFLFTGCTSEGHPNLPLKHVRWTTYSNEAVGYELQIPDVYTTNAWDDGSGVLFRNPDGHTVMLVRYGTDEEDIGRGLWYSHEPNGDCVLAGISGKTYDYIHWDGPSGIRTRSFVIPYKEKNLGIEFRTLDITAVEKHILDSFRSINLDQN